jgi:hypothetical protein
LTLYAETGAVAAIELDPMRAVALGSQLINAGLSKLG